MMAWLYGLIQHHPANSAILDVETTRLTAAKAIHKAAAYRAQQAALDTIDRQALTGRYDALRTDLNAMRAMLNDTVERVR